MGVDIYSPNPIYQPTYVSDVDATLCGIERQRPGSLSSALGTQSHNPSFPALPRPSGVSLTGFDVFFLIPVGLD